MTLEDLRMFITAYEARSMSEAARRLGCTQGAVAQHVRKLEQELGAEMFFRLRRGVAPTPVGTALYRVANTSVGALDQGVHEIAREVARGSERLRLSVSPNIAGRYFRKFIHVLQQRRPRLEVEIDAAQTSADRLDSVRAGRSDLAMVPLTSALGGLESRSYRTVELALMVNLAHPFARRRQLKRSELAGIRYIAQSHNSGTCQHIQQVLQASGITLSPAEVAADSNTVSMLVELGRGQTFVPVGVKRSVERTHRVKVVAVPDLPPMEMGWVVRRLELLPPVAAEFMDICDELTPR